MEGTDEREGTSTMSANTDKGVFGNKDCCVYTVQQACEDVPLECCAVQRWNSLEQATRDASSRQDVTMQAFTKRRLLLQPIFDGLNGRPSNREPGRR